MWISFYHLNINVCALFVLPSSSAHFKYYLGNYIFYHIPNLNKLYKKIINIKMSIDLNNLLPREFEPK